MTISDNHIYHVEYRINSRVNSVHDVVVYKYMARRKLEDRNVRKLTRTGSGKSISVTLPIEIVRALKWRDKQKVVVTKRGKGILIKDWKKKK